MELATDVNVSTVFAERRHVFQLWREKTPKKSERDNMKHNQSEPTGGDGEWRGGAKPKVKSVAVFFQKKKVARWQRWSKVGQEEAWEEE